MMAGIETCPFCLDPLGSNSVGLPCGHSFHSVCALQFLLSEWASLLGGHKSWKRRGQPPPLHHAAAATAARAHPRPLCAAAAEKKQCPCCRAPVDESRVIDISQLPPEATGRQFVQPADAPHDAGEPGRAAKRGSSGHTPGRIELQACAGSTAAAAAAAATLGGGSNSNGSSRRQSHSTPQPPEAPGPQWLPDIFPVSPRGSPDIPLTSVVVVSSPGQAAAAAAALDAWVSADQPPAQQQQHQHQPLQTIRVVRQRLWVRRLVLCALVGVLLAIIVVVPILLSKTGEPRASAGLAVHSCCCTAWGGGSTLALAGSDCHAHCHHLPARPSLCRLHPGQRHQLRQEQWQQERPVLAVPAG
jgi:hypothetical protein